MTPAQHISWIRRPLAELATGFALLTRLPYIARHADFSRGAAAIWSYPLVGFGIALIAGMLGTFALAIGLAAPLAALVILLACIVTTGAMHEDGLADSIDGLWGGWDPARRLAIMRDSHIGSYGVIALALSLAARWAALSLMLEADLVFAPLIAAAVLSRGAMPVLMASQPHARRDGLSHAQGRASGERAALGLLFAVVLAVAAGGASALLPAAVMLLIWRQITTAKIGGQTGDTLGAAQQIIEITTLFAFCAAL